MNILWELFTTFLRIGLFSIGGGYAIIPFIREQVVKGNGWIGEKMFTDIITISQMTPGPLAVNTSTFVGLQIGGFFGALAATIGCILCGIIISLGLYRCFQAYRKSAYAIGVLNALKSASLGLIISAAATIVMIALFGSSEHFDIDSMNTIALFMLAALVLLLRKRKIDPLIIMLMSGAVGLVVYL